MFAVFKRFALLFFILALGGLIVASLPLLSCAQDYPGNLPQLATTFGLELGVLEGKELAGSKALGVCWEVYPLFNEKLPFNLGLLSAGLCALFAALGRMKPKQDQQVEVPRSGATSSYLAVSGPSGSKAPSVEAIEVSESMEFALGLGQEDEQQDESPLGKEDSSLMEQIAFQEEEKRRQQRRQTSTSMSAVRAGVEGFFSPVLVDETRALFVDSAHNMAADALALGRGERRELPFRTLQGAIGLAKQLTAEDETLVVQIRVLPGVYSEAVKLPSRVILAHHKMPLRADRPQRKAWLESLDTSERVILRAPESQEAVLTCDPGHQQGLFGLHVEGKEHQVGVLIQRSDTLRMWWCVVEGCGQGGVQVRSSGREFGALGTADVHVGWSTFRSNRAPRGGGIHAQRSALHLEACHFEENQARRGGALFMESMTGAVLVERCEFVNNKAQCPTVPQAHVQDITPQAWTSYQGTGGAVYVVLSQAKFHNCLFYRNGASVAGGAIALFGSRGIVSGELDEHDRPKTRFRTNKARVAAALLVAPGPTMEESTCRIHHALFERNTTQRCGAMMCTGKVMVEAAHVDFEENVSDEIDGFGAGIALFYGAKFLGKTITFRRNKAGTAGAMYSLCASAKLREGSLFQSNEASFGRVGALKFLTHTLPFDGMAERVVLELEETRFVANVAQMIPTALGVGHPEGLDDGQLELVLGEQVTLRSNSVEGQPPSPAGEGGQAKISWKGKPRIEERAVYKPQKVRFD